MGQCIVGVTSFQKIYGLYSVEHRKVETWSYYVGCGWVLWVRGVIRTEFVWFQSFDEETYGPKLGRWEFLSNTLIM